MTGREHRAHHGEDTGTVLLVDAANVVGARPDGWWRDRAGATTRLLSRLAGLPGRAVDGTVVGEVLAVVEGAARDVPAPGDVRLVRAAGSGDDALAAAAAELAAAGRAVLAVTADRGLRARLPEGTAVTGPGRLLDALDCTDVTGHTDVTGRADVTGHTDVAGHTEAVDGTDVPDRMADNGPG